MDRFEVVCTGTSASLAGALLKKQHSGNQGAPQPGLGQSSADWITV